MGGGRKGLREAGKERERTRDEKEEGESGRVSLGEWIVRERRKGGWQEIVGHEIKSKIESKKEKARGRARERNLEGRGRHTIWLEADISYPQQARASAKDRERQSERERERNLEE